ncbi:MAG: RNA-binding protein [Gammaproteobacteria bacterium]|nr:RNA-binding protein [Gammaproteobacteria bacterium]
MIDAVYVGNLDESTTDAELESLFVRFAPVKSVRIIRDLSTGKSKGFGFVKLADKKQMKLAAKELNAVKLKGKLLQVSSAMEKKL